ncbi:hypothetical protein A8C32_10230 [Flavivirga aquatica]|uniref:Uncharacterized protein n=1 Tax=Flavivirga aquatica TaxID=1849968 RepID=A0A1E5TEV4_9FLAO|nr:hypothetical protein [Flavivirga aquatica]OEK09878.1 hypothetical protein A8C32_10230 [Flavivirga aquatica]
MNEFKIGDPFDKFIQTATINNTFYLISIRSQTSVLSFYALNDINLKAPVKVNLEKESFINRSNRKTTLHNLFTLGSTGAVERIDVKKIDESTPNSIDITSEETKLYMKNNKFIFTFDNNRGVVQILTVNPYDYSYTFKTIDKPFKAEKKLAKKSNSFILNSKLFVITSTKKDMEVNIQDYSSGKLLKKIKLNVNDKITFKNTPIIQEGCVYNDYRELESTKKFLRKLTMGDIGISAYKQNNEYLVTIGSEKEVSRGNGGMMMMPMGGFGGVPIAALGSANVFFNPTFFAYNSYSKTKSVHIKSLFDLDFNHIDKEIENNFFDKIKNHAMPGNLLAAKTIFKYKDYFILGNYISKSKTYILKKFDD